MSRSKNRFLTFMHYSPASIITFVALTKLKFKGRLTEGCYYIVTFLLCEASVWLSVTLFTSLYSIAHSPNEQPPFIFDVLWTFPAVSYAAFVSFNHLAIIYYTICEVCKENTCVLDWIRNWNDKKIGIFNYRKKSII